MKDYIESTWNVITKEFMRWYRVVVDIQGSIKVEGTDYPLKGNSNTYKKIRGIIGR